MRTCTKCGEQKPADDEHFRQARNRDGLTLQCRACLRKRDRTRTLRWREANPERQQELNREGTRRHRERAKQALARLAELEAREAAGS
ncbi:MAG: hypothetical protein M3R38_06905 [Actinomycetota bacterium]|nr:hypothetical protein [Actinomycetota bacterium]